MYHALDTKSIHAGACRHRYRRRGGWGSRHHSFGAGTAFYRRGLGQLHRVHLNPQRRGVLAGQLGGALGGGQDAELGALVVGQVVEGEAAEDVVHHRGRDAYVRVVGHAGRVEPHVGELGDVGLKRDAVLQANRDRHRERVHHAGQRRPLLTELEEHLARAVAGIRGTARGAAGTGAACCLSAPELFLADSGWPTLQLSR
jgi:hypothetical protein